jgi:type II secretory pathway predicted ATPase ExeA
MYQAFYGLAQMPFDAAAEPAFFVDTPGRQAALEALADQVRRRTGVITLEGWNGAGKTELLRAYERSVDPDRVRVGWITRPDIDRPALQAILGEMVAGPFATPPAAQDLTRLLGERAAAGQATVLLIDDTENLSDTALRALGSVADLAGEDDALVSIVLAVRPPFVALFSRPAAAALDRRAAVRVRLPLLTPTEARGLIEHRLRQAGAVDPYSVLSPEAVEAIVVEAGGIPRRLLSLADRVLQAGFRARRVMVDFVTAEAAIRGGEAMAVPPPARMRTPISIEPPRRVVHVPPRAVGRAVGDAVNALSGIAVPAMLLIVAVGLGYWLWTLSDDTAPTAAPTVALSAPSPPVAASPPAPAAAPPAPAAPAALPAPAAPTPVNLLFIPARRGDTLRTIYRAVYRTPRYRPPFEALISANPNLAPDQRLNAGDLVALPGPLINQ